MSTARRPPAPTPPPGANAIVVADGEIRAAILALAGARAPKTICPSEVARALAQGVRPAPSDADAAWRRLMPDVRRVAGALATEGRIVVTQRGSPATVDARGPIRLAQSSHADAP